MSCRIKSWVTVFFMAEIKTEGIVLHSKRIREADRELTIYSSDLGKITLTARGISKAKSKYGSLAELLSLNYFLLFSKNKDSHWYRLTQSGVIDGSPVMGGDLEVFQTAVIIAEFTKQLTTFHDPHPKKYEGLKTARNLLKKNSPLYLGEIYALKLLNLAGFFPEVNCCLVCGKEWEITETGYWNPAVGGLACSNCADPSRGGFPVPAIVRDWIENILSKELSGSIKCTSPSGGNITLREIINRQCRYHLHWSPTWGGF